MAVQKEGLSPLKGIFYTWAICFLLVKQSSFGCASVYKGNFKLKERQNRNSWGKPQTFLYPLGLSTSGGTTSDKNNWRRLHGCKYQCPYSECIATCTSAGSL